jgi:hypothetical protein
LVRLLARAVCQAKLLGKSYQGGGTQEIPVLSHRTIMEHQMVGKTQDLILHPLQNGEDPGNYLWQIGGNNIVELRGLIVSSGVTLQIERTNANERPIFDIEGGCILVENNATLIFSYYTEMDGLTICVKGGGTLIFDSESPGQSDGDRDKFLFNNIEIIVEPGSEIKFGNAEIEQSGSILIDGYIGNPCILNGDGSFSSPPPYSPQSDVNINIDIPPMDQQELNLFCEFLSAGTRIAPLPVEYLYFNPTLNRENRFVKLTWATAKEWENSHFEIERSVNGVNNWEKIGQMEGIGWSDMPVGYEFADEELPLVGGNVYYRLKQVDFDTTFSYSKVLIREGTFSSTYQGCLACVSQPDQWREIQDRITERQRIQWRKYPNKISDSHSRR